MSEHHIRLLTDCAMRSRFEAGHVIFREGEAADRFYLIEHGKVALESSTLGEPVRIDEIHDGDLLGWPVAFPAVCMAFHCEGIGGDHRRFLLRDGPAPIPRERSFSRLFK
jgi:CRP/FNR family cyclic AMP-dependent transcriptional regulator